MRTLTPHLQHASALVIAMLVFGACDSNGGGDRPESRNLSALPEVTLANETVSFRMDADGYVISNKWFVDPEDPNRYASPISRAGLWLAADQGGPRSNAATGLVRMNGFELDDNGEEAPGVFLVSRDSLDAAILNWPAALGAPVDIQGNPWLHGDAMAWGAYRPAPRYDEALSLQGIRVGMTTYLFEHEDLTTALFIRYDITNTGSEALADLHVGFGADTDLVMYHNGDFDCGMGSRYNQTGFDALRQLTYTYTSRRPEDGDTPERCYGLVAGYSFLGLSAPGGLGGAKLAHRIWTRDRGAFYPEYSGFDLEAGLVTLYALQGLSPTGDPMIDPTTGEPTRFAFAGDPITDSGWLGERDDVRSLLSVQPVDLAPGETRSMTVVWVFAVGANLQEGLGLFKSRFDTITERRDLWDY